MLTVLAGAGPPTPPTTLVILQPEPGEPPAHHTFAKPALRCSLTVPAACAQPAAG
jgi:hypothetical protein